MKKKYFIGIVALLATIGLLFSCGGFGGSPDPNDNPNYPPNHPTYPSDPSDPNAPSDPNDPENPSDPSTPSNPDDENTCNHIIAEEWSGDDNYHWHEASCGKEEHRTNFYYHSSYYEGIDDAIKVEETCTEIITTYICSWCELEAISRKPSGKSHDLEYIDDGDKCICKCKNCDYVDTSYSGSHSYINEPTVTQEPTATKNGISKYTCFYCGHIDEKPLDYLDYLGKPTFESGKVTFGTWPQSLKDDSVTIDETTSIKKGCFTYYAGSDDCWYAAYTTKSWTNNVPYDGGEFLPYRTYYFKVEPIEWNKVARQNNKGYLISAKKQLITGIPYYGTLEERTLNGETIYPSNYKYSNIRAFLNGTKNQFETDGGNVTEYEVDWTDKGFLQTAFTEEQLLYIVNTLVKNDAESTSNKPCKANNYTHLYYADGSSNKDKRNYTCEDTEDMIFLLSMYEATDNIFKTYSFSASNDDTQRICKSTDFTRATYGENYYYELEFASGIEKDFRYYSRSPYYNATHSETNKDFFYITTINDNGSINAITSPNHLGTGIVPALVLNYQLY